MSGPQHPVKPPAMCCVVLWLWLWLWLWQPCLPLLHLLLRCSCFLHFSSYLHLSHMWFIYNQSQCVFPVKVSWSVQRHATNSSDVASSNPAMSPRTQANLGRSVRSYGGLCSRSMLFEFFAVCANRIFDMTPSLQTGSYVTMWRCATDPANELVTEIAPVATVPTDTEIVPKHCLAGAVLQDVSSTGVAEVHRAAAAKWRGFGSNEKLQNMRVLFSAADFTRWVAGGLSDVETSLYAQLGVNAKHAGAHVATLMKAASKDHTRVQFIIKGDLPTHLSANFGALGEVVTNSLQNSHRAQRVLEDVNRTSIFAGALYGLLMIIAILVVAMEATYALCNMAAMTGR